MIEKLVAGGTIAYLAFLFLEYGFATRIRSCFIHVIHVNGSRGKSSVCRLIDSGLRQGGFRVLTKTTGTSPRVINVDGQETALTRWGKPSIREQLKVIRMARQQAAQVVVLECMALRPELQVVSQEKIVRADIGVVTNVRRDHLEIMGPTLEDAARNMGAVMPANGMFFTADERFFELYETMGREKKTQTYLVRPDARLPGGIDFADNVALALRVCEALGVERETALMGMARYKKDPGRLSFYQMWTSAGKHVVFVNALAANDPDSTQVIYETIKAKPYAGNKQWVLLINNRADRPYRMVQYVEWVAGKGFAAIWITGAFARLMKKMLVAHGCYGQNILIAGRWKNLDIIDGLQEDTVIFAVGNSGGANEMIALIKEKGEEFAGL